MVDAGTQGEVDSRKVNFTFLIRPEGFTHAATFSLDETVLALKQTLGKDLEVPAANLILAFNGEELEDQYRLNDYAFDPEITNEVECQIEFLKEVKREVTIEDKVTKRIEVQVEYDEPDVPPRIVNVGIMYHPDFKKPFLGGFRHKKTGAEYHHGSSQTPIPTKKKTKEWVEKFHRDTQTVKVAHRSAQSTRECATQMARPGLHVAQKHEKILHPKPYVTADKLNEIRMEKAVTIQCFIRGWFARKKASMKRQDVYDKKAAIEDEEKRLREEAEVQRRREVDRRMHPKTQTDFKVLHQELEAWRVHETHRIKTSELSDAEKQAALALVLNKESKLLQTIDRLKIQANVDNRDEKVNKLLELMSAPKKWQLSDGTVAEVETPFTMRAKELMDLYNGLRLPLLSIDERLDVLLHVKWTVKEFDCNLTREIVDLIDREADLLNRGRPEKSLSGLRKRLSNLFLQFIETPEFNPEAVRFQKVPRDLLVNMGTPAPSTNTSAAPTPAPV
eukprot:TRINITY_DN463_c0_g1_i1.p1 TRINITY_DN463_c0_g1~~TRINITY_DN463_c0_g1_i1.p1  ORF type:complete len:504 (+),score=127.03 TRINITY_DN463_c0_g1_i1:202-1713(+)